MPGCHVRRYFEDELVCVARRDSSVVRTLDQFLARGHVKMELAPSRGAEVDDALAPLRRARNVVLTVPNFSSALDVVARSDLLTAAPRSLALVHPARLRVTKLPVEVAPLSVSMYWHRRVHADAGAKALRDGLLALVGADRRLKPP